jgi:hypothetical protein
MNSFFLGIIQPSRKRKVHLSYHWTCNAEITIRKLEVNKRYENYYSFGFISNDENKVIVKLSPDPSNGTNHRWILAIIPNNTFFFSKSDLNKRLQSENSFRGKNFLLRFDDRCIPSIQALLS